MENVLNLPDAASFRAWLSDHGKKEKECYLPVKRGKPCDDGCLYYLDAVEVALCFGWVDSIQTPIDGTLYQRFSPRKKNGHWTELNKERVRRLERLGLMTDAGRAVLPKMGPRSYKMDPYVESALKKARVYKTFRSFPPLYQRVRASNVAFYRRRDPKAYHVMLARLIDETKAGRMYGEWNDYGRLLEEEEITLN